MNIITQRLKPYWKQLLVILVAHLIQSFCLLSLPAYTSRMVDTGIQNQGFQYSLPLLIRETSYQDLEIFMTDEEENLFKENYKLEEGTYKIDPSILEDNKKTQALEENFRLPMALYSDIQRLDGQDQARIKSVIASSPDPRAASLEALPEMQAYPPEFISNLGIQAALGFFEEAGGDPAQTQKTFLIQNGTTMLLIALGAFLAATTAHYVSSHVGTGMGRDLRADVFDKVIYFSNQELSKFSTASLITRTTNDIQQIIMIITMFLRAAVMTPVIALGGVIMVLRIRPDMAWIILLGLVGLSLIIGLLFKIIGPAMKKIPKNLDQINLVSRENLTGVQVIRAFGRQIFEEKRFDSANSNIRDNYLFIDRAMSLIMPSLILIADIMGATIIWVGGHMMEAGTMQVGQLMSFTAYSMRIFFSFLNISMMATMVPRAMVSIKRIKDVLDTPYTINDPKEPIRLKNPKGLVEFNNVSFTFPGDDDPVLKNLNFTAKPGQTTAIIGSTGSGKSTILNLIMRFVDPSQGTITIDGVDIRNISQKDLRDMIGYVPQKGVLFSGTIESNIGYGLDDMDESTMERAAEIAHAQDFIEDKECKYQSRISQGGSNVSGGQKQRLSIARAIAKDPEIYLFDDSFSALDYKTDRSLRAALNKNMGDATVIIVAQRISTILEAENILVLNDNKIEAMGTHQDLMENCQLYRDIARSQLSEEELKGGKDHE